MNAWLLFSLATAAASPEPLRLEASLEGGHVLRVEVVAKGKGVVLVTPRTTLGCYIEVEIRGSTGSIGYFGPRAGCPTASAGSFRGLTDGERFGAEFDIGKSDTVRTFRGGEGLKALSPGEYALVVTYHNDDASDLSAEDKRELQRKFGELVAPVVRLRSSPVSFRVSR